MENSIPLDHDLYMFYDDIKAISEITWKHPISWEYIRRAVEDAIPLIDYMGPDAISYVVILAIKWAEPKRIALK